MVGEVGRHEHPHSAPAEALYQFKELVLVSEVQMGGRFVQDERFRSLSERRCDHDKLALASRYVGVGLIGEMGYAQEVER